MTVPAAPLHNFSHSQAKFCIAQISLAVLYLLAHISVQANSPSGTRFRSGHAFALCQPLLAVSTLDLAKGSSQSSLGRTAQLLVQVTSHTKMGRRQEGMAATYHAACIRYGLCLYRLQNRHPLMPQGCPATSYDVKIIAPFARKSTTGTSQMCITEIEMIVHSCE